MFSAVSSITTCFKFSAGNPLFPARFGKTAVVERDGAAQTHFYPWIADIDYKNFSHVRKNQEAWQNFVQEVGDAFFNKGYLAIRSKLITDANLQSYYLLQRELFNLPKSQLMKLSLLKSTGKEAGFVPPKVTMRKALTNGNLDNTSAAYITKREGNTHLGQTYYENVFPDLPGFTAANRKAFTSLHDIACFVLIALIEYLHLNAKNGEEVAQRLTECMFTNQNNSMYGFTYPSFDALFMDIYYPQLPKGFKIQIAPLRNPAHIDPVFMTVLPIGSDGVKDLQIKGKGDTKYNNAFSLDKNVKPEETVLIMAGGLAEQMTAKLKSTGGQSMAVKAVSHQVVTENINKPRSNVALHVSPRLMMPLVLLRNGQWFHDALGNTQYTGLERRFDVRKKTNRLGKGIKLSDFYLCNVALPLNPIRV